MEIAKPSAPAPGEAIDPVCGMSVDIAQAKYQHQHGGSTWYFCGRRCLEKFSADPGLYVKAKAAPPPAADAGAIYTCPMHPEIRQTGPGACPKCGMALGSTEATSAA